MDCVECGREFDSDRSRKCPYCGAENPATSGVMRTSTILIATGQTSKVYRSVSEVPNRLRKQLLRSTNSLNSATILIADRRGREELSKAIRRLPSTLQKRLADAISGEEAPPAPARYARACAAILAALVLVFVVLLFTRVW